ncbi:MAG: hypothetical protein ACE5FH_11245, partial [Candidatus Zixiibacteriota bacterium]
SVGDLELSGSYGFAGDVAYKGKIKLSEVMSKKLLSRGGFAGGLAGLFGESSTKRIVLPIVIGGTLDDPSMNIDYSGIADNLGKNIVNDAGGLLKDLFKKK